MSISAPAASGPTINPSPFVVVASPATAPRASSGMSVKSRLHASVITSPPPIATVKTGARYHACHSVASPPAR